MANVYNKNKMANKENLEEVKTSLLDTIFLKIKPIYIVCAVVPLIIIYPKPLMLILKPIIRNWSFHYRKINSVANKPA